ncbi:hypothetical protein ABT237_15955 [Streptomyces sp. NPDC001581]|uniref:hypothetical protein n=1 Tax=Streptomyces sp. NPDC001581 TaxID=3154386 RepID=UPI003322DF30
MAIRSACSRFALASPNIANSRNRSAVDFASVFTTAIAVKARTSPIASMPAPTAAHIGKMPAVRSRVTGTTPAATNRPCSQAAAEQDRLRHLFRDHVLRSPHG